MEYILALDQGTTSSRAIVFDKCGRIAGMAQQEFAQIYPFNGWVEHDPKDILGSQIGVIPEALIRAGVSIDEISAIGITNQRETVFVWDKISGKPICNAIVWQCRRTAQLCERLKSDGLSDFIYEKTGLVPDAYFSATKLKWILDNVRGARDRAERGELLFGTVDTFLMWHLSKGKIFATDYTNASRTMLFNIHTLTWDDELLRLFGVPRVMLPEVYPSGHDYGVTAKSLLGESVPVLSVAGDQQAALFGHLCVESGSLKNTYGTGCFTLMNVGGEPVASQSGLVTSVAWSLGGETTYALEGSVFNAGSTIQWLRDELEIIKTPQEADMLAETVENTGGVSFVPAFTGLGAPYWDMYARGALLGVTRGTKRAHLCRAVLESIALESFDLVKTMEKESGICISELRVDGGASRSRFLMQYQADILNTRVCRPQCLETTALGSAMMAGLTVGVWDNLEELSSIWRENTSFTPNYDDSSREQDISRWHKAVNRSMEWAK